jgi:predicted nucleic acid-binding protein
MNLKSLCVEELVNSIKNLPPQLRDQIIDKTTTSIEQEAEEKATKKIMNEINRSAVIIVEDVTRKLIDAHKSCEYVTRPTYTKDIDDGLYYTFVQIAERFVNNYAEHLLFNERIVNNSGLDSDSDF